MQTTYIQLPRRNRNWTNASADGGHAAGESGPMVAAAGDFDGDGSADVVLGHEPVGGRALDDRVEVYGVDPVAGNQLRARISVFGNTGISASSNLVVGDVDVGEPGDEIVVGEDGTGRRARYLHVLGGLAGGDLRLLRAFPVVPGRMATRAPLQFAAGDVLPDVPGSEIVVADRRGHISIYSLSAAEKTRRARWTVWPDPGVASPQTIAIGDLVPEQDGEEVAVAIEGPRHTGVIRVVGASSGSVLAQFEAFAPGMVRGNPEVWVADLIPNRPGAELIVGRGPTGGELRLFSLAGGTPTRLYDFPDVPERSTTRARLLATGNIIPNLPGNEVAIAQRDAQRPVAIYRVTETGASHTTTIDPSAVGPTLGGIAVGP